MHQKMLARIATEQMARLQIRASVVYLQKVKYTSYGIRFFISPRDQKVWKTGNAPGYWDSRAGKAETC